MTQKRIYNEKDRQRYADFMRTKPEHLLRRIAVAYDRALDYVAMGLRTGNEALSEELRKEGLLGFKISYKQARIVYEMVVEEKYGGLKGPQGQQLQESQTIRTQPANLESNLQDCTFPEISKQTPEEYLKKYEEGLIGGR